MKVIECAQCHRTFIPPKFTCRACGHTDFQEKEIPEKGKILSFTTIWVAPESFMDQVPYDIVVVELADKLRVTGRLLPIDKKPTIDAPVEFDRKDEKAYWFKLI